MGLVLYGFAGAPSPRRTRIFLAEKGVDYEAKSVDLATGARLSEDFRMLATALFEVSPLDPLSFAIATALIFGVSGLQCFDQCVGPSTLSRWQC